METSKYGIIWSQNVHFVTTLLKPQNKKRNIHLRCKFCVDHKIWNNLVTKCSFRHNLTGASKQKTYLTKVVKEYVLMKEMP